MKHPSSRLDESKISNAPSLRLFKWLDCQHTVISTHYLSSQVGPRLQHECTIPAKGNTGPDGLLLGEGFSCERSGTLCLLCSGLADRQDLTGPKMRQDVYGDERGMVCVLDVCVCVCSCGRGRALHVYCVCDSRWQWVGESMLACELSRNIMIQPKSSPVFCSLPSHTRKPRNSYIRKFLI